MILECIHIVKYSKQKTHLYLQIYIYIISLWWKYSMSFLVAFETHTLWYHSTQDSCVHVTLAFGQPLPSLSLPPIALPVSGNHHSILQDWLFSILDRSEIMWLLSFCVWPSSQSIMVSRSSHDAMNCRVSSLLWDPLFYSLCLPHFTYLFSWWMPCCFHIVATVNSATVIMEVQMCLPHTDFISFGHTQ